MQPLICQKSPPIAVVNATNTVFYGQIARVCHQSFGLELCDDWSYASKSKERH